MSATIPMYLYELAMPLKLFLILIILTGLPSCSERSPNEIEQDLALITAENIRLRDELKTAQKELARRESNPTDRSNREVIDLSKKFQRFKTPLKLTDPNDLFVVEVLNILLGQDVVDAQRSLQNNHDDFAKQGKKIVYFEVRVLNRGSPRTFTVTPLDFILVDTNRNTYLPEPITRDFIKGKLQREHSTTGGITFALYGDAIPQTLSFDTGEQIGNTQSKAFANLTDLERLDIFKVPRN